MYQGNHYNNNNNNNTAKVNMSQTGVAQKHGEPLMIHYGIIIWGKASLFVVGQV